MALGNAPWQVPLISIASGVQRIAGANIWQFKRLTRLWTSFRIFDPRPHFAPSGWPFSLFDLSLSIMWTWSGKRKGWGIGQSILNFIFHINWSGRFRGLDVGVFFLFAMARIQTIKILTLTINNYLPSGKRNSRARPLHWSFFGSGPAGCQRLGGIWSSFREISGRSKRNLWSLDNLQKNIESNVRRMPKIFTRGF